MATTPDEWPISAASTAVLLDPRADGNTVYKLALKELVLRRVWRLERTEHARILWTSRKLHLVRGAAAAPSIAPLGLLDEVLRSELGAETVELRRAMRKVGREHSDLGTRLRDAVREDLAGRGLAEIVRTRMLRVIPRTSVVPTDAGVALAESARERQATVRSSLGDVAVAATAAGALVLLLDPPVLEEIDAELRRTADGGGGGGASHGGDEGTTDASGIDLSAIGSLDALDSGIDSAVDAGGGDGGGGDGGGGGGD